MRSKYIQIHLIWFHMYIYTQIICREPVWHAKVSGSDNGKLDSLALIVMSRTRIECQVAAGQIGRQIQQARNLGPRVWPIARRRRFAPHSSNKKCLRCTLCSSRSESTRGQAIRVHSARPFAPLCLQVACVCVCVCGVNQPTTSGMHLPRKPAESTVRFSLYKYPSWSSF